jgi:PKD repeat protein
MKKLAFVFLFWTAFLPLMAQVNYLTVQGYVTDSANGTPVPNHAVTIQVDSSSGFFYYNVVYTWSSGFYLDTIFFNLGTIPTSNAFVSTQDCNQNTLTATLPFGPGNQNLYHDFQICNTPVPCDADFTWNTLGNLSVQFTDLSTSNGGNLTWSWDFGDLGSSNLQNPAHTYANPGTYAVGLSISDNNIGCSDNVTKYVYVGDSTGGCTALFQAVADTGNPMNIYFYDQSIGNNISYWHWDFGDGSYSNQQNPVHLFSQQGTYYVCLTIQSNDSTCYNVHCDTIYVGNGSGQCHAQFTWYADSLNTLNTIQFIDLSTGGISGWWWDFGDSTYSTLQNPVHTFPQAGTYYVCLTVHNQDWTCQDTWCVSITTGNNSGCVNYFLFNQNSLTVSFTGNVLSYLPATYSWSFGDGTGGSGQNVTHTYAGQGMYYVSLTTVTDSTNCTYTSGQTIQVGDSSEFNQIYGQVLEFNFPLTSGIAMIFSLDTLNTIPYNDLSIIDSMGIYSFPYVPQGNFVVWVIPTDSSNYLPTYYGDVITWQQATVITLGTPNNPYNIHLVQGTGGSDGPGGINGHINTGGLKSGLSDKIRMILMNEQGIPLKFRNVSTSGDFDFSTLGYGVYFLRAELPGCPSDVIRVELTSETPVVNIIMTYNGKHILGVNEHPNTISSLESYPNPFKESLTLNISSKENAAIRISLCDLTGREAISTSYNLVKGNNSIRINTASLQTGMFLLRINAGDGPNVIQKLLKIQ